MFRFHYSMVAILLATIFFRAHAESPQTYSEVKSDLALPLASVLFPGLGLYFHGDVPLALGFTAAGALGLGIGLTGSDSSTVLDERDPQRQKQAFALTTYQSAGFVSAYFSFRRSIYAFQQEDGKYAFLNPDDRVDGVFLSPFRLGYLRRPTTWIPLLTATGLAAGLCYYERKNAEGGIYAYKMHDAFYTSGLSYNAGVAEEAAFRGYIFPFAQERLGNWFVSDAIQAMVFGLAHYGDQNSFPVLQTALGFYFGYLTKRNNWSIEESVFLHFWYDVIVFTGGFLSQRENPALSIHFEMPLVPAQ